MNKGRKFTGKKYVSNRKKKSYEGSGQRRLVFKGEEEQKKSRRVLGGNKRVFLTRARFVNLAKAGKKRLEVLKVLKTPSNRFLARKNIITKGTIIETSLGEVRITNRPSREGNLNGVLVK